MASSNHIKDYEQDMMDEYHQLKSQYPKWCLKAKDKLKAKLADNLSTRVQCIENAVDHATNRILDEQLVPIMDHPEHFRVSSTIKSGALERMNHIIESWGGVDISQCENIPKDFKRYWRLSDNWYVHHCSLLFIDWFGNVCHLFFVIL